MFYYLAYKYLNCLCITITTTNNNPPNKRANISHLVCLENAQKSLTLSLEIPKEKSKSMNSY